MSNQTEQEIPQRTAQQEARERIIIKRRRRAIVQKAKAQTHREGEIEIDDDAPISDGRDNGCYVQAWIWFPFEGTPWDKENEDKEPEEPPKVAGADEEYGPY
jgi:hypothetical protein